MDEFTDEILDPRRTTRRDVDPVRDRPDSLIPGDLILVPVDGYKLGGGLEWCVFAYSSPGSAAVYPYKADIPGLSRGQWRAREIHAWARPVELHRRLREFAAIAARTGDDPLVR